MSYEIMYFNRLYLKLTIAKGSKLMLILTLLTICFHYQNFAQSQGNYQRMSGGLLGGFTASQVDGDGYKGYDKFGWTGGGIIYVPFSNIDLPIEGTLALSMEVLFTQKGSIGRTPTLGIYSQTINLTYAEVPLQINYYRGTKKSHIGMGLCVGYLGWSEEVIDLGGGALITNDFPFRKFDLSFVLTPNIHIYKGFFLSPRFQYSLIPIRTDAGGYGRNEQYNNNYSIRIMYLFGSADNY